MDSAAARDISPVEAALRSWKAPEGTPIWFADLKRSAIEAYLTKDFPEKSDENWHYGNPYDFDLKGLEPSSPLSEAPQEVAGKISAIAGSEITYFYDSGMLRTYSAADASTIGITVLPLAKALRKCSSEAEQIWQLSGIDVTKDKMQAAYIAASEGGVFIDIPKGTQASKSVHIILHGSQPGSVSAPVIFISAGNDSSAELYLHMLGANDAEPNLLLNLVAGTVARGSNISLTRVQHLGSRSNSLSTEKFHVEGGAKYRSINVNLGGRRVRNELGAELSAPEAEAEMFGLHLARGRERYDFLTLQDHRAPHCRSNLLYKGAMLDRSKASYQGTINVVKDAQKTDAYQTNRSLLLSPDARVDSSPQLEIEANDVKCSHGSSISNVTGDVLFYLESRGIDPQTAKHVVVSGFLKEVTDKIAAQSVRDYIDNYVLEQLD